MLSTYALPTRADLTSLALRIANDPGRWMPIVRFDEQQRWYTRLAVADNHEVWLLSWLPGQRTEIHDHGDSAGAFAVAQGVLTETTVCTPAVGGLDGVEVALSCKRIRAGMARGFDADHVHEVTNDTNSPAVSIHVYAPALTTMNRYRIDDGVLRLRASEGAGADW